MLKKTDDPALNRGVRVFWIVVVLAPVMFLAAVPNAVWDYFGSPGLNLKQKIFLSVISGLILGVMIGCAVYYAGDRRRVKEEQRDMRRADENRALGPRYASIVEATRATVSDIRYSEAARSGLLGDIDFDADIRGITDNLRKAHELQKVADKLAALDKPSADDRKILAEAKTTVAKLETTALNRVELIAQCAAEAQLVDKSLHEERQDAKTSAQRAELHAKLAAMLYGIEATPDTTPTDSAADAVLLRVRAYREIKNQIRLGRD